MMSRLKARAESAVRAAQRRRIEELSAILRESGLSAEAGPDWVACRGRRLTQWLGDPALRFITRNGS